MTLAIAGPMMGPLASRPGGVGTVTYEPTNTGYTVAIGGVPFFIAPKDDTPYQRATAQFRKQQFDAAQTPGDQSLDGMWLRGQFSFHRGAGVRFFESLDGDITAHRFNTSTGINPWTPGQATMCKDLVSASGTAMVDAVGRPDTAGGTPYVYAITDVSGVDRLNAAGSTACTGVTTATSITASDTYATFITDGTKVKSVTSGTAFGDVLTQSDGRTFVCVAWAKGRLFAVDTSGYWYAKPDAVASVASADAFWNSGITSAAGDWSVADTPASVYLAKESTIYSLSLDTDGSVPTLTAPVVAATLPPGETVKALGYSLGWLVVVSSAGVRVADLSANSLTLGPLLLEFASSTCRKVATWGNLAYVTGAEDDADVESTYFLDLTQVIEPNVVAFAMRSSYSSANTGSGAAIVGGLLATFGDEGVLIEDATDVATSAVLTTGSIRFGTMEPKAFHSVRVKAEGGGGTVSVELIRKTGVAIAVGTLAVANAVEKDMDLNLGAPEEYVGLRFTLEPDAVTGGSPTLLGYQLRALPAPAKRSRMISLPLLCYDREDSPEGVVIDGGPGSAFERLTALEAMEQSAGLVIFQDFRVGETATCFIEEVSFINRTAPNRNAPNFGGIVNVTLRKVS